MKQSNEPRKRSLADGKKGDPRGGTVPYEPFENPTNLKRFLRDLSLGVLSGKLYPRQASTIRACIGMWIRLDEHSRLDDLEKRIEVLEGTRK